MEKQYLLKVAGLSVVIVLVAIEMVSCVRGKDESRIQASKETVSPLAHPVPEGDLVCDPESLPSSGSIQVIAPERMQRTDVLFSGLEIENRQAAPVVAYLTDRESNERVLGIFVWPAETAQASVPVGNYGLFFLKGGTWCNEDAGFRGGSRAVVQNGVEILNGETRVLLLAGEGAGRPEGIYTSARTPQAASRPPLVQGDGSIELAQRPNGHYSVDAYLNGAPIDFMVDTGATLTTLSQEAAYRASVEECLPRVFHTANGAIEGCVGTVRKFQFGGFVLHDIKVGVLPNQTVELLGMNVLSNFRVEQQGGVMRISAARM